MKKRYVLTFPKEVIEVPVTYTLIKQFDIKVNILNAYISSEEGGNLAIEMEGTAANIQNGIDYIKAQTIACVPLEKKIHFRTELCVHCGACVAVCFAGALTLENTDFKLKFDAENCIVCELCTTACPLRLFKIDFVE